MKYKVGYCKNGRSTSVTVTTDNPRYAAYLVRRQEGKTVQINYIVKKKNQYVSR